MQFAAEGMSTASESPIGLPVSSVSSSASSSLLASMRSASLSNTRLRALGSCCDQLPRRNAARALATARSMSRASPAAIAPSERPVAGLMLSKVAPLTEGTNRPSMNTPERSLSAAARSRHCVAEMGASMGGAADMNCSCLESRRGGGRDDLTDLATHIAESVWRGARKIVGVASFEYACLTAHGQLHRAANHDAALLAAMRQHVIARGCAGIVSFVQHRELSPRTLRGDQSQGCALAADFHELIGRVEHLGGAVHVQREELGHRQRHAVQYLLERTDRGADTILLYQ